MGKTSATIKNKYNKKTYQSHIFTVQLSDELNYKINEYKKTKSLSKLIRTLLKDNL